MISLVSDTINKEDIYALCEWLQSPKIPRLTKGDLTVQLERKWSEKLGTGHAVFVNSGSSAIFLALAAIEQAKRPLRNKKIVIPALSWSTDLSSAMLLGFQPLLCDCNLTNLSCDLNMLEDIFIRESPSIFICVSILGLVPDMKAIVELCNKYNVILLEDVCESMGSTFKGNKLGTFGYASVFSMFFGHHISTIEGGFINTDDPDLHAALNMMRSHGWDRDLRADQQAKLHKKYNINKFNAPYTFYLPGMNLRSTDLQAFLGLRSLDRLDDFTKKRQENFKYYTEKMKMMNDLFLPQHPGNIISNFAYPMVSKYRSQMVKALENRVETRPLIAGNLAMQPVWRTSYPQKAHLPNATRIHNEGFYLPNHQDISEGNIDFIFDTLESAL